jgi:hypothetical protein
LKKPGLKKHLSDYKVPPWIRILLEKLLVKFPSFYATQSFDFHFQNNPSLVSILNRINPVHILPSHVFSNTFSQKLQERVRVQVKIFACNQGRENRLKISTLNWEGWLSVAQWIGLGPKGFICILCSTKIKRPEIFWVQNRKSRAVTAWAGGTKYQTAWFLLNRVYNRQVIILLRDIKTNVKYLGPGPSFGLLDPGNLYRLFLL